MDKLKNNGISRRQFLQAAILATAGAAFAPLSPSPALAAPSLAKRQWRVTGEEVASLASFDQTVKKFMQDRNIPGGALAVTRNSKLVLARGYTWSANPNETVQPTSLFRIASVTKPFTSAAVMTLVQNRKLKLSDKVVDVLDLKPLKGEKADVRLADITVLHLLQHLGGWDRDTAFDPMFRDSIIARQLNTSLPISTSDIITYMTGQPLQFDPGAKYVYSNFGYCLLGRVIEKTAKQDYETYVQSAVLQPLGISRMKLGRSLLAQRAAEEVSYYTSDTGLYQSVFGSKEKVPIPYRTFNLENMDSHGRWLASPIDLVRFAASYDGENDNPVLTSKSIKTTFDVPAIGISSDGSYYGCGWAVRPVGKLRNTWHDGSLPGTSTLMVRRFDGLNWAILFNQRDDPNDPTGNTYGAIDGLLHQAADAVTKWPDGDLFGKYTG